MLRGALLVIGHILTVDIIGLVQKMVGGIQKHRLLKQVLPSLFSSFTLFSLSPPTPYPLPPPLFASATQAIPATKCQFCKQEALGILAMLVLDFTIHYIQSGSGCNDENTNLAKNSPEQHIGKNYNKMQETLLVKCQVFRKMANLVIFNEKSGKTLPMALWILY